MAPWLPVGINPLPSTPGHLSSLQPPQIHWDCPVSFHTKIQIQSLSFHVSPEFRLISVAVGPWDLLFLFCHAYKTEEYGVIEIKRKL
ncbi:hypothetical protein Nmel_015647 [Mimus melanotis]